jgi:hypothetical protein
MASLRGTKVILKIKLNIKREPLEILNLDLNSPMFGKRSRREMDKLLSW